MAKCNNNANKFVPYTVWSILQPAFLITCAKHRGGGGEGKNKRQINNSTCVVLLFLQIIQAKGHKISSHIFRPVEKTMAKTAVKPSNAELNPTCHLLALLGAHHILQLSTVRVNISLSACLRKLDNLVPI